MRVIARLRKAAALLAPSEFALRRERCVLCGCGWQVRLRRDEIAVRCLRCGASAITQSLVDVVLQACGDLAQLSVYELSAAGALVDWLRPRAGRLITSEFFDAVAPGESHHGVVCQDVQRLTFDDACFDVCTSTEVFEHVEDDIAGFREILRVLRPGGVCVFTVPLGTNAGTVERTAWRDGRRVAVLPAEYHADRYRGQRVFCYRNYGTDIVARLRDAGFASAEIVRPRPLLCGHARAVIVARKSPGAAPAGGT
jgi:SAM-dependent methyltransferase